jgi:hypothetical protein
MNALVDLRFKIFGEGPGDKLNRRIARSGAAANRRYAVTDDTLAWETKRR